MKTLIYLGMLAAIFIGVGWWWMSHSSIKPPTTEVTDAFHYGDTASSSPGTTGEASLPNTNNSQPTTMGNPHVTLKTNKGDITLELFMDKMPITAGNFIKLAKEGYYTKTKFHRVIPNFMIQGGDPLTKDDSMVNRWGTGGPGYTIKDEFVAGLSNIRGTIAMANTGQPNSGGSQFFINTVDNLGLDFDKPPTTSSHPVFGKVTSGMEVVDAISNVARGAADRPNDPVIINEVVVQ